MHNAAVTPSLIFDLDGTLVDSLPGIAHSLNRALDAHHLPQHSTLDVRGFVGDGLNMLVKRALPEDAREDLLDAVIADFKKDYALSWPEGTRPYDGIPLILKEFQRSGYPLAVLSNKTHEFTRTITREVFPLIHFTLVLGQQPGVPHKPYPAGAFKIANAMGCDPEHCILIGDSSADIETAANANMQSIAVTWGYHDRPKLIAAGATLFADNPADLPRLIRQLETD